MRGRGIFENDDGTWTAVHLGYARTWITERAARAWYTRRAGEAPSLMTEEEIAPFLDYESLASDDRTDDGDAEPPSSDGAR